MLKFIKWSFISVSIFIIFIIVMVSVSPKETGVTVEKAFKEEEPYVEYGPDVLTCNLSPPSWLFGTWCEGDFCITITVDDIILENISLKNVCTEDKAVYLEEGRKENDFYSFALKKPGPPINKRVFSLFFNNNIEITGSKNIVYIHYTPSYEELDNGAIERKGFLNKQ